MKIKFKDGTIIEVLDSEGKSKEEIINEAKKIKSQMKDASPFNEEVREKMRQYLISEQEITEDESLADAFNDDLEDCLELIYWGTQYESAGAIDVEEFKKGVLYEWCDDDILENITKEYVRENDYEEIYSMEEFDEIMSGYEPWDLAKTIFNSDYNPNHKYFKFRGDGNLQSFNDLEDELSKYEDDAIKWAIGNNQNINCDMYNVLLDNEDTIVLLTYFVINELGY